MKKTYTEDRVFEVLALALDDNTENHRIAYLIGKLRASEGPSNLDSENTALKKRIEGVALE